MNRRGNMVHKIKQFFNRWYVQLIIVIVPLLLGLIGYFNYYNALLKADQIKLPLFAPIFSTLRLFVMAFDAQADGSTVIKGDEWFMWMLAAARILAVIPTGHILFTMLRPLIKQFVTEVNYRWLWTRHEQVLLIGCNEENRSIYNSVKKKDSNIRPMILCETEEEFSMLYDDGYNCFRHDPAKSIRSLLNSKLIKGEKRCTIIINTKDEEKNLKLCGTVVEQVQKDISKTVEDIEKLREQKDEDSRKKMLTEEKGITDKMNMLHVVVFGDAQFETAYQRMEEDSYGILRYTNKARKSALELVHHYPLSGFIDRSRYINEYGCIDKKFNINFFFIGFGIVNREVFSASTIINQFVEADPGEIPHPKKVNYYIYDLNDIKNKNLNHKVFRFSDEFLYGLERGILREEDYLEIPPNPTEYVFMKTDINSPGFYDNLWTICSGKPDSLNIFSVALGDDLENIDMAQKILDKVQEWEIPNSHIFVNIKKEENRKIMEPDAALIPFGGENDIIFNLDNIYNSELEEMARKKHYMNALIKSGTGKGLQGTAEEIETESLYEWQQYDAIKKMSALFSIISLRSKLQIMGLDYRRKQKDFNALKTNEAYFNVYAQGNKPERDQKFTLVYGKEIYRYPKLLEKEDLTHQSLRQNLAIQEHYRWNAFMISCGFVPSSREKIIHGKDHQGKYHNGKDYKLRMHGNLTTMAGLVDFRKLTVRPNRNEAKADVINYDFQIMDDAWWYLNMFGYEIYRR